MKDFEKIPAPPEKPDPDSCCGSGCVPCIYDYYEEALYKWQEKYGDVAEYHKKSTSSM